MKKSLLLFLAALTVVLASCSKSSTKLTAAQQAAADDAAIQAYISANNIKATKDSSGLYYQIITPGTGAYPNVNATVEVNSVGKLLDGTVFDTESSLKTTLTGTIKGWQIGVPHINTGGRILLIVPSALGYGTAGSGSSIPANAVLVFTIDLLGFN